MEERILWAVVDWIDVANPNDPYDYTRPIARVRSLHTTPQSADKRVASLRKETYVQVEEVHEIDGEIILDKFL